MARGRKPQKKKADYFRRPNGTGCIKVLSGNRRKPYAAVITTSYEFDPKTLKTKQIQKVLDTFKSKEEAKKCLDDYNENPYDLDAKTVTFKKIYDLWSAEKFKKLSEHTKQSYNCAYKYCAPIEETPVYQLKTAELQNVINSCPSSYATKKIIKTLMIGVFTYCMQNDIVEKNYAGYLEIEPSDPTYDRVPFTKNEINFLWSIADENVGAKVLLILLYSGLRVNELLKLPRSNCNISDMYFDIPKELAKNKSSIRKVPIHPKVQPLVLTFYNQNKEYLMVKENGTRIMYNNFVSRDLKKLNQQLEINHRFHDTRHTFITRAHELNMDEKCLKKIVGHISKDITSRVYTHISLDELKKEICKIRY